MPSISPAGDRRHPSHRVFLLSVAWAVLVFVAVHFLDFPGSVVDFTRASGGRPLLDLDPIFSDEALYRRLADYGAAGRDNYAFRVVTTDVLLPLSLLPFLYLLMRLALSRFAPGRSVRRLLLSLPLVYVAFDLAENAAILALVSSFPDRVPLAAAVLPYLTLIKRAGVMLSLALPLAALAIASVRSELADR